MKIILYSPMTHMFQVNFMVISWRSFSFSFKWLFHCKLTYMKWTAAIRAFNESNLSQLLSQTWRSYKGRWNSLLWKQLTASNVGKRKLNAIPRKECRGDGETQGHTEGERPVQNKWNLSALKRNILNCFGQTTLFTRPPLIYIIICGRPVPPPNL